MKAAQQVTAKRQADPTQIPEETIQLQLKT
jgi:hypothetical protein